MEPQQLGDLIAQAQQNQAQGYEQLLSTFGPRLYGYFLRSTGDHHDAEDLLGELCLKLVQRLKEYDHRGRFEPWIFRIACNMVRDRIRRRQADPVEKNRLPASSPGANQDDLPARWEPVEARLEAVESNQALHAALGRLDSTTREMILLRHFGDLSFKEIAEIHQCPLGTALAKVHRGLRTLRRYMGEGDETDD